MNLSLSCVYLVCSEFPICFLIKQYFKIEFETEKNVIIELFLNHHIAEDFLPQIDQKINCFKNYPKFLV